MNHHKYLEPDDIVLKGTERLIIKLNSKTKHLHSKWEYYRNCYLKSLNKEYVGDFDTIFNIYRASYSVIVKLFGETNSKYGIGKSAVITIEKGLIQSFQTFNDFQQSNSIYIEPDVKLLNSDPL